jgi:hypothetical protein
MICLAAQINTQEDIIFSTIISEEEETQIGQWVLDEYQDIQIYALVLDIEVLTQRLADFQAGNWPE